MKAKPARENPNEEPKPQWEGVSSWTSRAINPLKTSGDNASAGFALRICRTIFGTLAN